MQWSDVSFSPGSRTLRQFALLWIAFWGGMALWHGAYRGNGAVGIGLATLALTIGVIGLCWPQAIRWIFVGWTVLAFPLGWLVSKLILGILYYGVFTPVALVFRLTGRDALALKRKPEASTYWQAKEQAKSPRQYFRQY
jgi:Saxitoxin biosynthesis operon protein SxtJ